MFEPPQTNQMTASGADTFTLAASAAARVVRARTVAQVLAVSDSSARTTTRLRAVADSLHLDFADPRDLVA